MNVPEPPRQAHPDLTRRQALQGATAAGLGLPLLAGCGGTGGAAGGGTGETAGDGGPVTLSAADVPVGGGTVARGVVVTQPTEGEFRAFTATCTHQGCLVTEVADGEIRCPCHQSRFSAEDGSVVGGPAPAPLAERAVAVEGDRLTVA